MLVEVTKEKVAVTQGGHINSGEMNVNTCTFSLPECFEGLNVTACFNGIPVPIVKNSCVIPALKQGTATLGVYAYKENENGIELIYSPEPTYFCVHEGSFTEDFQEEPSFEISEYEQYCNMLKSEYEKTEAMFSRAEEERKEAELSRANAEEMRQSSFATNEAQRQATFELNEQMRESSFYGSYTNLLQDVPEDSTTDFPTQFPYKKNGVWYSEYVNGLKSNTALDCYIIQVAVGERFNISNFTYSNADIYIVDEALAKITNITKAQSNNLCGGLYAMPENAEYLILHTVSGSAIPCVTRVSESVITNNDSTISNAQKFITRQARDGYHLCYDGGVGGSLVSAWKQDNSTQVYGKMFASGIYPLEKGKEYVICYNDSVIPQYAFCGFICDENFVINTRVEFDNPAQTQLDINRRYVFTATENDKYIALNCFDFEGNLQLGEATAKGITKLVKIGNVFFDGKNDISLGEIGGVDRSLADKKWVSYGDSITWGSTIADGEKKWQDYIVDRYSIGSHVNMGVGSTSIGYKDGVSLPAMCSDDRLNSLIAEAPDIVTVLGGANDLSYNIPVGADEDIDSRNKTTFKGAYAYIVDKILTSKPDTILVLMGMYRCADDYYGSSHVHSIKDYAEATKEVAEHFGLPFIDLNECGFNKYNFNTTDGVFSVDGIHPNKEGAKRIAMVVSKWFDAFNGTVF